MKKFGKEKDVPEFIYQLKKKLKMMLKSLLLICLKEAMYITDRDERNEKAKRN